MVKYLIDKESIADDSDSSMFRAKIREEDLKPEEALQNIEDKLNELSKDQLLKEAGGLGKAQSVEEEICKETHEEFESLLDEVKLFAEENNAFSTFEELLERICSIFESALEYLVKPLTTAKKEGWLFSLLRKFLSQRLSWEEMLDNEIAELREKLENDDLSAEERAEIMQRLKVLQEIKLHKITAIGLIIGIIASFIGFGAAVARSGEIVKDAIEKLSQAQEAEQKECEKETANHKAEDKAKEKEQEEENKRKCSELSGSIFKALSDKRLPSGSVIDALMPTMLLLDNVGYMANDIINNPMKGKTGGCKSNVDGEPGKNLKASSQQPDPRSNSQDDVEHKSAVRSDGKQKEDRYKLAPIIQQVKNTATEGKGITDTCVNKEKLRQGFRGQREVRKQAKQVRQAVPPTHLENTKAQSIVNQVEVVNGRTR